MFDQDLKEALGRWNTRSDQCDPPTALDSLSLTGSSTSGAASSSRTLKIASARSLEPAVRRGARLSRGDWGEHQRPGESRQLGGAAATWAEEVRHLHGGWGEEGDAVALAEVVNNVLQPELDVLIQKPSLLAERVDLLLCERLHDQAGLLDYEASVAR